MVELPGLRQYADTQGREYTDGIIPEGIFADGQTITAPQRKYSRPLVDKLTRRCMTRA